MKISTNIIFWFVLVVAVSLSSIGFYNSSTLRSIIIENETSKLDSMADIQEERLGQIIEKNLERIKGITSRTQLRLSLENYQKEANEEDREKIQKIITDAKNSITDFKGVSIVNSSGDILFSTMEGYVGQDASGLTCFQEGLTRDHMSAIESDKQGDYICLSGPLVLDDQTLGVAMVRTEPDDLLEVTSDYTGLNGTGETLLAKKNADGDAVFFTPIRFPELDKSDGIIPKDALDVPMTQALLKNESIFENSVDYKSDRIIAATRYLEETD